MATSPSAVRFCSKWTSCSYTLNTHGGPNWTQVAITAPKHIYTDAYIYIHTHTYTQCDMNFYYNTSSNQLSTSYSIFISFGCNLIFLTKIKVFVFFFFLLLFTKHFVFMLFDCLFSSESVVSSDVGCSGLFFLCCVPTCLHYLSVGRVLGPTDVAIYCWRFYHFRTDKIFASDQFAVISAFKKWLKCIILHLKSCCDCYSFRVFFLNFIFT